MYAFVLYIFFIVIICLSNHNSHLKTTYIHLFTYKMIINKHKAAKID